MTGQTQSNNGQSLIPERQIKELEVLLKEAQEKSQFFKAIIDVLKKDDGVCFVKKPVGKHSRKPD